MLIKKINIKQYKNLKDCEIEVKNDQQVLSFIGTNGSGKSNLLEAISILFKDAFIPKSVESKREQYQISLSYNTYADETKLIELSTKNTKVSCKRGMEAILPSSFRTEQILPKRIVAIYSGEADRLKNTAYKEIYNDYIKKIKESFIEPKMIYLDKSFLDISLFSLLLNNNTVDTIKLNQLEIKKTDVKFSFDINTNKLAKFKDSIAKKVVENIPTVKDKKYSFHELNEIMRNLEINVDNMFVYLYSTKEALNKIKIYIKINDADIDLEDLSEGEKKKLLVKCALECIGTEDTLFLLDEPDAYIHLSNKEELTKIINENKHNSTIILTTHSPTFTNSLSDTFPGSVHLMEPGKNPESVSDKIKTLKTLCTESNIFNFLFNTDALLLVEGVKDVRYIKTAIDFYKESFPLLKNIDILPCGGAPNICGFIESLKQIVPIEKKLIAIFDRDGGGTTGINKCLPLEKNKKIEMDDNRTFFRNDIIYLMLPKYECKQEEAQEESEGYEKQHKNVCFLIEDYFSYKTKKSIAAKIIDEKKINIAINRQKRIEQFGEYSVKDLTKEIKDELANKKYHTTENMEDFKILLKKIQDIIEGKEKLEVV